MLINSRRRRVLQVMWRSQWTKTKKASFLHLGNWGPQQAPPKCGSREKHYEIWIAEKVRDSPTYHHQMMSKSRCKLIIVSLIKYHRLKWWQNICWDIQNNSWSTRFVHKISKVIKTTLRKLKSLTSPAIISFSLFHHPNPSSLAHLLIQYPRVYFSTHP